MATEVFINSPTPGQAAAVAALAGNGGSISATATSFNIAAALPSSAQAGGGQFRALVDSEMMIIPTQTGTALTGVTRGAEGTVATAHSDGASVYALLTAGALSNAISAVQTSKVLPTPSVLGTNWLLAFDDEFSGATIDTTRWETCDGWVSGGVTTAAANLSVSGGVLTLAAPALGSGSRISSDPALGAGANGFVLPVGGVVEARIMFPGSGSTVYNWPTFWVTADNGNWPAGGEEDIVEASSSGSGALGVNYHYGTVASPVAENGIYTFGAVAGAWHVFTFYRGAGTNGYQVYLDGTLVASWTGQDNGIGQGISLSTGANTSATGELAVVGSTAALQVDYVRAWVPPGLVVPAVESVNVVTASGAGTVTLPATSKATIHRITLTGNATITPPAPLVGASFEVELTQDSTGSRVPVLSAFDWGTAGAPTLSTAAGKTDVFVAWCSDGVSWKAGGFQAGY